MVWTPSPPVNIPANSKLAQLVPFKAQVKLAKNEMRGEKGFGSTGQPEIYLAMDIGQRKPIVKIKIWNPKEPDRIYIKDMLLDTGADVTIFSLGLNNGLSIVQRRESWESEDYPESDKAQK